MSDLFCAATIIVARHGDAEYVESAFTDEGGSLTLDGRRQSRDLAALVADRRVARVWSSDVSRAVQTAEIAAAELQVGVTACKALREIDIGDLRGTPFSIPALHEVTDRWFAGDLDARFTGGESGHDVVARYGAQLAEIADQHRGETVLVVAHQMATCITVPSLAGNVSPEYADTHQLRTGESAELMIDADGTRLVRWGDRSFPARP